MFCQFRDAPARGGEDAASSGASPDTIGEFGHIVDFSSSVCLWGWGVGK